MTIQEAIKEAQSKDIWFRPVGMNRYAYCINRDIIRMVPSFRGGFQPRIPNVSDLLGEWEVVEPETVNNE